MITLDSSLTKNVHVHDLPEEIPPSTRASIRISYIGGGSREWATKLMADLALSRHLSGELRLYDIDLSAARHNEALGQEIFRHPEATARFSVRAVATLEEVLSGADFVVISIEPGPITMRAADLDIPARHGILQTVGDTTGPGGILRALRTVPIYRGLAEEIMTHCPRAWVINYTNPMAICTGALHAIAPGIRAFGCCHEVFGTQKLLASLAARWFDEPEPERHDIRLDICGVNHFTFASQALWQGRDLFPRLREMVNAQGFFRDRTREAEANRRNCAWFESEALIAFDFFRRFGALGAAGDRHLAEFVPWYLGSESVLHRWGVVATPFSYRLARSQSARPEVHKVSRQGLAPSGEEGVAQIEALLGLRELSTNVNLPNQGQIPWLPCGIIVETYASWDHGMLRPLVAQEPSQGLQALITRAATQQRMILEASLNNDTTLAFEALLCDPLVHLPTDCAWAMFQEMLVALR